MNSNSLLPNMVRHGLLRHKKRIRGSTTAIIITVRSLLLLTASAIVIMAKGAERERFVELCREKKEESRYIGKFIRRVLVNLCLTPFV